MRKNAQPVADTDDDAPSLNLLPGDFAFDVDAITAFYTAITGKTPTPAEIAEARAYLDAHKH